MQVRVFTAPRLHEALALIRKELGPDAVVLDHMEGIDSQGNKLWHVHAALDTNPSPQTNLNSKQVESNQQRPENVMDVRKVEASMQRLERIVEGLGRKETDSLRKTMNDKPTQEAFDHLVKLGVAPAYAFDLANTYANHLPIGVSSLRWATRITPRKTPAVVLLAGPSGGGKTLLAAKLATHYSMRGVRVGLMTTDTARMGGSDALRSYAGVLGAPFALLRSKGDVPEALASMSTAQLMLIDTEGWNAQRVSACRKQFDLWDQLPCTHRILVMPANMDENDGMALLAESDAIQMTELAFTKLDETARPGKIINWAMVSKLGLSYGGFGSDVPGQMGWLTPQSLTALLESQSQRIKEAS
ncbi:MAG: GTP-binding protein [Zetaproteobacteria bacterium]|nr:GTP-binding protein [Zetaproteobacteria bacterium]